MGLMTPEMPSSAARRDVLRATAATAGLAVAGSFLPPSVHRAMSAPMKRGGLDAIEHVILLMQENRSFDHYFGTLRGVRGYDDRNPLRRRAGDTVLHQAGENGDVLPFSLREAARAAGRPSGDIQYLSDLPHGFGDATGAWADGWWDEWVPNKGQGSMTFYDRRDIGLQYELAETFTILDAYHCSVYGSTNPNRNYFFSGTVGTEVSGERAVTNAAYDKNHPGYDWTTYPERLEAAGVSWQIYQEWDNFTDNAVEYFRPFKEIGRQVLARVEGAYRTTEEFYESLRTKSGSEQDRLLAQLEEGRETLSPQQKRLFDRAMYRSRPDTLLERIREDIERGDLPQVVWVVPTAALSEHPGSSTPVGSANLIYDLLDVIASDRKAWSSTATFINFDENDGYFDHVPPPVAPRPDGGNSDDWFDGKPIGFGPRVPMTVVSPWTVGGFVDSTVSDHTSVVRFLERWTGVEEPNISVWRRQVAGDLTSAFDFMRKGRRPLLTQPGEIPSKRNRWQPKPPAEQAIPEQEKGRAPSRRTPYASSASLRTRDGGVRVTLRNDGRQAAPFAVYDFESGSDHPEHRLVAEGASRHVDVAAEDRWDVVVQGPDRFWVEATGTRGGSAAGVDVVPSIDGHRLRLMLAHDGDSTLRLTVTPLAYKGSAKSVKLKPGQSRAVPWPTDHGWYDVEVTCEDDPTFRRRITGRIDHPSTPLTA